MKKIYFIQALIIAMLFTACYQNDTNSDHYPAPKDGTIVRTDQSEGDDNANR